MFEATQYIPQNENVDWRALADQVFPADALRPAPAVLVGAGFKPVWN